MPEQQRPAATADIDQLAVDEERAGRFRRADIERSADRGKSLFEHAAELDRNSADIDGEAIDFLGRRPSAEAVLVVDHNGVQSGMGKSRGSAKPARTGTNDDSICLNNRHPTSQNAPRG